MTGKSLAQWQRGMPAALKAQHDAMTLADARKAAADLRQHADMIEGLGIALATNERNRQHYFEALAASKAGTP
jgi:hypothetical protein